MAQPPNPWPKLKDIYVKSIRVVGKRLTNFGPVYVLEDGSTLTEKEFYDLNCKDSYYPSFEPESKVFEAPKKTRETLSYLKEMFPASSDEQAEKTLESFKEAFPSSRELTIEEAGAAARGINKIIDHQKELLERLDKMRERELKEAVESYNTKNKIISNQVKILRGNEEDVSIFSNRLYVGDADVEILEGFQGDFIHLTAALRDKNFSHRKIINRSAAKIKIRSQEFIDAKKHLRFIEIESHNGSIDIDDYSGVNVWAFDKTKEIKVSDSIDITVKVYGTSADITIIDCSDEDVSNWFYGDFRGQVNCTYEDEKPSFFQKLKLKMYNFERMLLFPNKNPIHDIL